MCHLDHSAEQDRPNRRSVLRGSIAGALAAVGLSAKGTVLASNILLEEDTPGVTEGPYWVDEKLNRSDIRSDPATGVVQQGLPLYLAVNVSQLSGDGTLTPLTGAYVDIWHANSGGVYSDIAAEDSTGQQYLRGYQVTNAHGNVKFTSIYPGWYSGRTPHIHARVRVYDSSGAVTYNFTTQFFFDDAVSVDVYRNVAPYNTRTTQDTLNAVDMVWTGSSNDGTPASNAGQYMMLRLAENRVKATASFNVVLDLTNTANENIGGGTPPGGGGTPPGGGGTPPGGGPPPGGGGTPPGGGPPSGGMSSLIPAADRLIPSKASILRA